MARETIVAFLSSLDDFARPVMILAYHERFYPADFDDVAFLLCAVNGDATHLATYDAHLLDLAPRYSFRICRTTDFLADLRDRERSR